MTRAAQDLTGQRFGRLQVLRRVPAPAGVTYKNVWWLCRCDCGQTATRSSTALKSGHSNSCGCYQRECYAAGNGKDITGLRSGKLVAVKRSHRYRNPQGLSQGWLWLCQCDCGEISYQPVYKIVSGINRSCGCGSTRKRPYRKVSENGSLPAKSSISDQQQRQDNLLAPDWSAFDAVQTRRSA